MGSWSFAKERMITNLEISKKKALYYLKEMSGDTISRKEKMDQNSCSILSSFIVVVDEYGHLLL